MPKGGRRTGSGRKRKPAELKVLEGSFRKDRHGRPPKVVVGFPEAPEDLTEAEAKLWADFPRVPWVTSSDRTAVHGAVAVYARILAVQKAQQASETYPAALVTQEAALWGRMMSFLASLGLTPADRAKMVTTKGEDVTDKWAGIL